MAQVIPSTFVKGCDYLVPLCRNGHVVGGLLRFRTTTKGPQFFDRAARPARNRRRGADTLTTIQTPSRRSMRDHLGFVPFFASTLPLQFRGALLPPGVKPSLRAFVFARSGAHEPRRTISGHTLGNLKFRRPVQRTRILARLSLRFSHCVRLLALRAGLKPG
jgi:hypothetical protein